jgi:hypothetical protein
MKNNFILAESEKKRIPGLHNKYINKPQTWVIKEEFTGTAGDGYDGDVAACKKDLPYNVAVKTGQIKSSSEWRTLRQAWGSDGSMSQNLKMRDEMCDGWRSGDSKESDSKESDSDSDANSYYDRTKDEEKEWEKWGCITSKTGKVVARSGKVVYQHKDGQFEIDYTDSDYVIWRPVDGEAKVIYSCDDPIVVNLSGTKTNDDQSSTDNGSEVKTNTESDSNVENVINTKKTEISELIIAIQNDAMYGYSEDEDKKEIEDSKTFIETINATNVCSEENIEYYKKKSGSLLIKKEKQKTKTFAPEISKKMGEIAGKLEEIIVFCKSQVNESFRKDFYRFL